MSFMDKAKDAVDKFKNSDNEQVQKVKDKINEYTGSNKEAKKEDEDK
ncbi:SAS049 family protein [Staphylococcus argenteus]